ncbi:hypothetical protein CFIMG_007251RA00001 [Ceratocystis fimbriata CBS 114723]|uniref:Uncharacterized protein n=1 Tax=Ceratocystis fimbriata CBS 114723 TaxID=1035309 RepID=A0A2C5WZW0_9PEZI|nr:hypothetical protein CFIMG_007251RA00001 [Ceratocystis fimbriata CBS 114723]
MQFWTASVLLAFAANAVMAAPSPGVDMDDMDMGENGYYDCDWYHGTDVCMCTNVRGNRVVVAKEFCTKKSK